MKTETETSIQLVTARGDELEGHLVRLGRYDVALDLFGIDLCLRTSEVVPKLTLRVGDRLLYEGKATVSNLLSTTGGITCKLLLDERGIDLAALAKGPILSFGHFQKQWLASYRIRPEIKIVVADFTILLSNASKWMEQVELTIGAKRNGTAEEERRFLADVVPKLTQSINALHERFEDLADGIDPELRGVHQNFVWRAWSPFFLSTPFGYRTYYKPLGYAGDYEMMNMIHRNAPEGPSLFAKAMHQLLVSQWPAESVRNRIAHLKVSLINEVARVVRSGRRARILNVGCGPAWEVQEFLRESVLSDQADLTFMDFDKETLEHATGQFHETGRKFGRTATLEVRHMSVQHLLRSALQKTALAIDSFDLVYCAGLFDYLSSGTCKALVNVFYTLLSPGGLVIAANMNDSRPYRNFVEFLLDWHLIYRDSRSMRQFAPDDPAAKTSIITEPTTVNLFLESRRPA